jgi:ribonucleoside-diphosphate reductase alpha chain
MRPEESQTLDATDVPSREPFDGLLFLGDMFLQAAADQNTRVRAAPPARQPHGSAVKGGTYVINRRGEREVAKFDRITERNEGLCSGAYGPELALDCPAITAQVVRRFRNGMTTADLDAETAAICISLATHHSDYEWLAARMIANTLHKRVPLTADGMVEALLKRETMRLSGEYAGIVRRAAPAINERMVLQRDYRFRYFGWQTMARSYLLRPGARQKGSMFLDQELMELPQQLYMRVALGVFVCQPDGRGHEAPGDLFDQRLQAAFRFYDFLSLQKVSNATPTMVNAGTVVQQLSSCFQLAAADDLSALYRTVKHAAEISKWSGGISIWLHGMRAEGSLIRKTGGLTTGVKRYLRVLNDTQLYVDQGGSRNGAFAVYLGVDHDDIFTFLRVARPKGEEALANLNSPNMKYALWVPDAFMRALVAQLEAAERAEKGVPQPGDDHAGDWHLFSPDEAPGLHLVWGAEYDTRYAQYVAEGRYRRRVKASDVIAEAFKTWGQAGTPYVLYKDTINRKSNLKNVAPICSSNLCTEVLLPSWNKNDSAEFAKFHPDNALGGEYGVCNLAAICLESFVLGDRIEAGESWANCFDYACLGEAVSLEVRALNRVIDLNYYPTAECRRSNQRHRPIGIGIMGLADVLARFRLIYGSPEAQAFARGVSAAVYFHALGESCDLAVREGSYASYAGSPVSQGILQPDMWVDGGELGNNWENTIEVFTGGYLKPKHWANLRARCEEGVRNGYVTAYMPTVTTSNVAGQNECFEPFTSNLYTRKTGAGEFVVVNRHLMAELTALGLWDEPMRRAVLAAGGSVQDNPRIPPEVQQRYRTAREIHPTLVVRMAAAMAPFVCQSMSLNLFLDEPNLPKILRFMVESWRAGLKGQYYVHTAPAAGTQMSSVANIARPQAENDEAAGACSTCVL